MKDLILNNAFDFQVAGGDLVIGDSQEQSIALLAATSPGQWRERPTAGMGLVDLLKSDVSELKKKHTINVQLRADGAKLKTLKFEQEEIVIDAYYEG